MLAALAGAIGIALVALFVYADAQPMPIRRDVTWGVTFSEKASVAYGLDWRANYRAIVGDLRPASVRLIAYWDLVEPTRGHYDFRDLDWQVSQAETAGIPVVIALGQKTPRWPEYHYPRWLDTADAPVRDREALRYVAEVVQRYRDRRALVYWQVENEPFVDFGRGPALDTTTVAREVALVRRLDPRHPVLMTDSGEWGRWYRAAALGDVLGVTLYRRVYDPILGSVSPPFDPEYYLLKERLTRMILHRPRQRVICVELAAEPWGPRAPNRLTMAQQAALFPPEALAVNVAFARKTDLDAFYFWGVEWWYYRKVHGDPVYWDSARAVIRTGRAPALPSR